MSRRKFSYEETHKKVNGIEYKLCADCNNWLECTGEYFYQNKKNKTDGLHPICKRCSIEKQGKRQRDGGEELLAAKRQWYKENRDLHRARAKRWDDAHKDWRKEYSKEYREQNRDRINAYCRDYQARKAHDVTVNEWKNCLRYFNHSCAYCGMSQKAHKKRYGVGLHKEHVVNDGKDNLKNIVPSCQTCNSEKHIYSLNSWFKTGNPKYSRLRYLKIYYWLKDHCHMFIEKKKRLKRNAS